MNKIFLQNEQEYIYIEDIPEKIISFWKSYYNYSRIRDFMYIIYIYDDHHNYVIVAKKDKDKTILYRSLCEGDSFISEVEFLKEIKLKVYI